MVAVAAASCALMPRPDLVGSVDVGETILPMAAAALDAGQTETARRLYRRLLEADEGSAEARMGLGRVAMAERDAEGAARWHLAAAMRATDPPQRHEALLAHGRAALAAGQHDAALRSFARLASPEENASATYAAWGHNGVGMVRWLEGDPQGAVAAIEKAILRDGDEPAFRSNMAAALEMLATLSLGPAPVADAGQSTPDVVGTDPSVGRVPAVDVDRRGIDGAASVIAADDSGELAPEAADRPPTVAAEEVATDAVGDRRPDGPGPEGAEPDRSADTVATLESWSGAVAGESASDDVRAEEAPTVVPDEEAAPVPGEGETAPDPVEKDATPGLLREEAMTGPVEEDATPEPVEEDATPGPLKEDATPGPVEEEATPGPVEELAVPALAATDLQAFTVTGEDGLDYVQVGVYKSQDRAESLVWRMRALTALGVRTDTVDAGGGERYRIRIGPVAAADVAALRETFAAEGHGRIRPDTAVEESGTDGPAPFSPIVLSIDGVQFVQVGAYRHAPVAESVAGRMRARTDEPVDVSAWTRDDGSVVHRVRIGPFHPDDAAVLADVLEAVGAR